MLIVHLLYIFKFSHRETSFALLWTVDILIGGALLIWTLTSKIVKQVQLDYKKQIFTALYLTVFSDKNELIIPFHLLSFKFDKEPTRHQPKKWTLRIYNNKMKVFSIETNRNGFSQATIEDLVKHLNEIKQKSV